MSPAPLYLDCKQLHPRQGNCCGIRWHFKDFPLMWIWVVQLLPAVHHYTGRLPIVWLEDPTLVKKIIRSKPLIWSREEQYLPWMPLTSILRQHQQRSFLTFTTKEGSEGSKEGSSSWNVSPVSLSIVAAWPAENFQQFPSLYNLFNYRYLKLRIFIHFALAWTRSNIHSFGVNKACNGVLVGDFIFFNIFIFHFNDWQSKRDK